MHFNTIASLIALALAGSAAAAGSLSPCHNGVFSFNDGGDSVTVYCKRTVNFTGLSQITFQGDFTRCADECHQNSEGLCCAAQWSKKGVCTMGISSTGGCPGGLINSGTNKKFNSVTQNDG